MRKITICLATIVGLAPALAGAEISRMQVDHYCAFKRDPAPSQITTFNADKSAIDAVKRISSMMGLVPRFEVKAADVANAAAVIRNKKRYILYNPDFMETVNGSTRSNWSEISILAHEIAHHLNNHTLENDGSRPDTELEADQFSGFILQKMGASLQQAKLAMQEIADDQPSATHPAKSTRMVAIALGWRNARGDASGSNAFTQKPLVTPANNASMKHSHNGRQHSHPLPADGLNHQHGGHRTQPANVVSTAPESQVSNLQNSATVQSGSRFIDNRDGTVFDRKTNLRWKKCPQGMSGSNCEQGFEVSLNWQEAQNYRKTGWCLPSKDSLISLHSELDSSFFPSTPVGYFWSGTTYEGDSYNALVSKPGSHSVNKSGKSNKNYTRFIRCR